jgi:hypothetical protein
MNGSNQSTRLRQIVWQRERGEREFLACSCNMTGCTSADSQTLSFSHTHTLCHTHTLSHTLSLSVPPQLSIITPPLPAFPPSLTLSLSLSLSLSKVADKRSSSCRGHWIWLGLTHSQGETVLPTVPATNQCKDTPSSTGRTVIYNSKWYTELVNKSNNLMLLALLAYRLCVYAAVVSLWLGLRSLSLICCYFEDHRGWGSLHSWCIVLSCVYCWP